MSKLYGSPTNKILDLLKKGSVSYGSSMIPATHAAPMDRDYGGYGKMTWVPPPHPMEYIKDYFRRKIFRRKRTRKSSPRSNKRRKH